MPNSRVSTYDMVKWLQTLHSKGITKFKFSELPNEYRINHYFKKAWRQGYIHKISLDSSNRPVSIWEIDVNRIHNVNGLRI